MAMPTVRFKPVLHEYRRVRANPRFQSQQQSKQTTVKSTLHFSKKILSVSNFCRFKPRVLIKATSSVQTSVEVPESADVLFSETFQFKRTETVEGKILVRLEQGKQSNNWQLNVGCNIAGKWVLHWGVTYWDSLSRALGRSLSKNIQGLSKFFSTILHQFSAEPYMIGNEWDQPPPEMVPSGSIPIKGYAIETPLKKSQSAVEGQMLHEVQIDFNRDSPISAIHFVLKEEETGAWYQHRGRDFRILLTDYLQEDFGAVDDKKGFSIWPGAFDQLFNMKTKESQSKAAGEGKDVKQQKMRVEGFYEEFSILKETPIQNTLTVSVSRSNEKDKNLVLFDTDLPGDVVIHWGVCRDSNKRWEIPQSPHPSNTHIFRDKALQTSLQTKDNGNGSWGLFSLDKEFMGLLFVLKLNEYTWLNNMGKDFYIPIYGPAQSGMVLGEAENRQTKGGIRGSEQSLMEESERDVEVNQLGELTDGIIGEIRNLVGDISSIKSTKTKSKNYHENILQEIERLAAEAYSIFRSSPPTPPLLEEPISVAEPLRPPPKLSPGTGSGYEVLCQGFNWESHKSGRWYLELYEKAAEIASLGFTIVWLPPPTESVSPEGYMPKDLYNLNSRYGSMDELKRLVKRFHEVGVKVLGDAVLNHRCASYKNQNGVWNIFGGRINWDDRAVVADDPHFQGRGNKSSGDNFHAAPNIDHSQDFVRNDLKEWLQWLRKEIGYDGWRLDFVRGFWGGYVKDYIDASEPYFCVGEFWDSLSYTYGEMDHNQDAHRQRIVDWINATGGSAGAFDVTTKGILHSALEKCQYWRLSDKKGKPPGVLGWWPSRAVTFIENHDTGSTQGHWRFPSGKEMQGYAYILTHPGTPAVFYDHIFSHYRDEILSLISLRDRTKIHCRSIVKIAKAERDVYAADIDNKLMVKIGPGHYDPPKGAQNWAIAAEGRDYKVWEAS